MNRKRSLIGFIAAGFGSGYSPVLPGTAGTVAAVPIALLTHSAGNVAELAMALLLIPLGAAICNRATSGDPEADPGWIVIDEISGFLLATLWLAPSPKTWIAAFFLFRLFDILKPPPVGYLDRNVKAGWGIMLDDVAAGLMARLVLVAANFAGIL